MFLFCKEIIMVKSIFNVRKLSAFRLPLIVFIYALSTGILFGQNVQKSGQSQSVTQTQTQAQDTLSGKIYVIDWDFRPGDALKINVLPDTGFPNGLYPVDGQGYVDLPIVGPIQVTSISKADFQKKITDSYINLLRFSNIQVRRVISIGFQGGFQRPGLYWVSPGATLWYTISMSGGPVREDGFKRIKWERSGKIINRHLANMIESQKPVEELGFRSGDVLRSVVRPQRTGWDVFRQDVLPLLSLAVTSSVTALSVYQLYLRK
jgi:protein involved in polysaccharide export with SLBB domain